MGLLDRKHIPNEYLINSRANRLKLLAGLIDSDGHYLKSQNGPYEITLKLKELSEQINQLCNTLGYRTSFRNKVVYLKGKRFEVWRVRFNGNVSEIPVRIPRKRAKPWSSGVDWTMTGVEILPDGNGIYYGFELGGDGQFLLEDMTVSHNTALLAQISDIVSERGDVTLVFTKEMTTKQWVRRIACRRTKVNWLRLKQDMITEEERQSLLDEIGRIGNRETLILDGSNPQTTSQVSASCYHAAARFGRVDWVMGDHLRLFADEDGEGREVKRMGHISWGFKKLANQLETRALFAAQLSRQVEGQADRRPDLKDLRDSGEIEENSDIVIGIYRDSYYKNGKSDDSTAELWMRKARDGERDAVAKMVFIKEYMGFEPLAAHSEEGGRWYDNT